MTFWSHWVALSWPCGRREEGKPQEMSFLWAPHCWKEVGRRPDTSPVSLGPPSMCSLFTGFSRASLLLENPFPNSDWTELQTPRSLCGELDPHDPLVGRSPPGHLYARYGRAISKEDSRPSRSLHEDTESLELPPLQKSQQLKKKGSH